MMLELLKCEIVCQVSVVLYSVIILHKTPSYA